MYDVTTFRLLTYLMLATASLANGVVAAESWVGVYQKGDGTKVGISEFHEFGKAEILVDYNTGEAGALFELPGGTAGVSRAIGSSSPPPVHVLARKSGEILLDGQLLRGAAVKRRSFEVRNGSVTLAGELVCTEEKPKGVLMLIHGSGDGPRHAYDLWTNFFLSCGWAVVVYDKRGSGQSTGDWHGADFTTLADDARSILRWARSQDELRGLKFGLWGVSQAG